VGRGAALVAREGDFGFSPGNGQPDVGHDIELVNFSKPGQPLPLSSKLLMIGGEVSAAVRRRAGYRGNWRRGAARARRESRAR
jgi:hypothetical protein